MLPSIRKVIDVASAYRAVTPWAFVILGWVIGASVIRVKSHSIFEDATVVGVLAGVWLAAAAALVLVPSAPASSPRVAALVLGTKAIAIFTLFFSAYTSLFFATFTGDSLHLASGKYFIPGPFVGLIGFCVGWMLLEAWAILESE
jgi:hypothetical protein